LAINQSKYKLVSLNIVLFIALTVTMLMGALIFFVGQSNSATHTLIEVMGNNHTITRKMQLYGQLMEYARSRTRLSSSIILEQDPFNQDEIGMELEIYANRYSRARLELLSLPLFEEEIAVLESQNSLVSKILPASREAAAFAMQGDVASRQKAQNLLDNIIYPGQAKLIDGFLQLMETETQRQSETVEKGRAQRKDQASKMLWITYLTLSIGMIISLLVVYRVYQNQKEVNNSRQYLETMVKEKTYHLQHSEERLNRSQEIAHVGTWDWDIKEDILYWSDEIFRMFGLVPQQFKPSYKNFKKYIHKEDIGNVDNAVQSALENKDVQYHVNHRIIRMNGEIRNVEEIGQVVRDEDGTPLRMIGVVHDITERMQAEKIKNEFVSTVSHELRTPLTAMKGSLKLLLGNVVGELKEDMRNIVEIADSNCDRLLHLVNDILDLQKMESGKMEFQFSEISLENFMSEVMRVGKSYADAHHIKLVKSRVDEAKVNADQMRLMQVMNNLISNAVKFSDKGKEVEVSAVVNENDKVIFSVRDYGRGIPEEFRDRLFKRFTQVDSSDKREKLGTGLGLAISSNIIEEHKGHIWYESELGSGTTFYFELETKS